MRPRQLVIYDITVSRLAMKGVLVRLEHGFYHHRNANFDRSTLDFLSRVLGSGQIPLSAV
jgi:hypothetical protein